MCATLEDNASLPTNEDRSLPHATAATKLFHIPELLEIIYEHLDSFDLLSATQVSRPAAELQRTSTRIRKLMCLEPDDQPALHLPLLCRAVPGLRVEPDTNAHHEMERLQHFHQFSDDSPVNGAYVRAAFAPTRKLPLVGSRARGMLICQPPVKAATLVVKICAVNGPRPPKPRMSLCGTINRRDKRHCEAIFDISSTTGITTGDLLDATQRFRQERALYPWPQKIDVDDADRGSFHVRVDLKAEIPGAEWVDLYAQHTSSCFDQETLKYECPGRLEEEARIARGNGTDLSSRPQILSSSCADFRGL